MCLGEGQVIISPLPRFGGEGLGVRGPNDPRPRPLTPGPSPRPLSPEYRGEGRTIAAARLTHIQLAPLPDAAESAAIRAFPNL